MILDKIRTAFPEINRTPEQDLLIGSTCLALTDQERNTINNLNFNSYESSLNNKQRTDLSLKTAETVANAQWWGKTTGCVAGGTGAGAAAWYLAALSPLLTAASGVAGGYLGFQGGKKAGGELGHKRAIKNMTDSPEFIRWKDEKYATVVLPALSRYVEPDENSQQLMCPITFDWMKNPVQADDGRVYEKEAMIKHLIAWMGRLEEMLELRPISTLSPKDAEEILNTSSPFRNAFISIHRLKELPGYYKEEVRSLAYKYNMEVLRQRAIVYEAQNEAQELPEEVSKVVRFYSMTQERRDLIKADMRRDLLVNRVFRPDEQIEEDQALDLLTAAAKPPELIKFMV
ncbi:MAG: hypothetical protein WBD50_05905 [Candidatus Rhabdochlamydia sp.]